MRKIRKYICLILIGIFFSFIYTLLANGFATISVSNTGSVSFNVGDTVVRPGNSHRIRVAADVSGTLDVSVENGYRLKSAPFVYPPLAEGVIYGFAIEAVVDDLAEQDTDTNYQSPIPEVPNVVTAPQSIPEEPNVVTVPQSIPEEPNVVTAPQPIPEAAKVVTVPKDMALIPSGTNEGVDPDFGPYRISTAGFYMDKTEISGELWESVYNWALAHGYRFDNAGDSKDANHPVHSISYYDCVKWCNARSEKDGLQPVYYLQGKVFRQGKERSDLSIYLDAKMSCNGYRLPTRRQWEYAARGGKSSMRFPWGNNISWEDANYRATEYWERSALLLATSDATLLSTGVPLMEDPNSYDRQIITGKEILARMTDKKRALEALSKCKYGQIYDEPPFDRDVFCPEYYSSQMPFTIEGTRLNPNGFGLYNMVGNVAEWLHSASHNGVNKISSAVIGGSWLAPGYKCRFGKVDIVDKTCASFEIGFRTIRPLGDVGNDEDGSITVEADVYHRDYDKRLSEKNLTMPSLTTFSWVTVFTDTGHERRDFTDEQIAQKEWSLPDEIIRLIGPTEEIEIYGDTPSSNNGNPAIPNNGSPLNNYKFASCIVPPDKADIVFYISKYKIHDMGDRLFANYGDLKMTLLNRTGKTIESCHVNVMVNPYSSQCLEFKDIPPNGEEVCLMILLENEIETVKKDMGMYFWMNSIIIDGKECYSTPDCPTYGYLRFNEKLSN